MKLSLPWRRLGREPSTAPRPVPIELRIGGQTFAAIRKHIEDATHGEEAAFLFCGVAVVDGLDVLLVREWLPVPMHAKVRSHEYGMEWTPVFSAQVLAHADRLRVAVVLIHYHGGSPQPRLSDNGDQKTNRSLFPGFSRVLSHPCGSVVLGDHAASGVFWRAGQPYGELARLRVVDAPVEFWLPKPVSEKVHAAQRRHDRTMRAIGAKAEAKLASAAVAVIGLSGGGSHVCQQLAHLGIGRIVPIDGEDVADVNLGRMVGSTPKDVGKRKTDVMVRLIRSIDPGVSVEPVPRHFPHPETLSALKGVDVVVACVDSFLVRADINTFCRRHHLPLIDIGLGIETKDDRLLSAHGQLIVVTPDSACLRCGPLLSDEVLEKERRERPPGYDRNRNAPGDPQVVSMNGTLGSEAVNAVLDFISGYAAGKRGAGWWLYDGRGGQLTLCDPARPRAACPACAEAGHGDPIEGLMP